MASAGSPLENVATTWPLITGEAQSSASCTVSVAGHPAGAAKLLAGPIGASASLAGVQPATASLAFGENRPPVDGCTTKGTTGHRTSGLHRESVTSPR